MAHGIAHGAHNEALFALLSVLRCALTAQQVAAIRGTAAVDLAQPDRQFVTDAVEKGGGESGEVGPIVEPARTD